MSKRSTSSTLAPHVFGFGQGVYAEDLKELAEMLNYAGAQNPVTLASMASGLSGWGSTGNEVDAHGVTSGAAPVTWYTFQVYLDPDAQSVYAAGRMNVPAGAVHSITFTVGGGSIVLSFDNSGGGSAADVTQSGTVATSSTGTGLQTITVAAVETSGSGALAELEAWTLRTEAVADGSLPDPVNE